MSHLEPAKYQHGHHIAPTVVARNPFVCKDLFLKWMPFGSVPVSESGHLLPVASSFWALSWDLSETPIERLFGCTGKALHKTLPSGAVTLILRKRQMASEALSPTPPLAMALSEAVKIALPSRYAVKLLPWTSIFNFCHFSAFSTASLARRLASKWKSPSKKRHMSAARSPGGETVKK